MRFFIILFLLSTQTLLIAGREHIRTGKVKYETQMADDRIKGAINKALVRRGWQIQDIADKKIHAYLAKRGFRADIELTWEDGLIKISYLSSVGLNYKEKRGDRQIHKNYNGWISNLERDITVFLYE